MRTLDQKIVYYKEKPSFHFEEIKTEKPQPLSRSFEDLQKLIDEKGCSLSSTSPSFLPVGEWFKYNISGEENNAIHNESHGDFPIPEREKYLRQLKPDKIIRGISIGRKFNYSAFVFGKLAIVDSIGYGNATYLFEKDDKNNWLLEADREKIELVTGNTRFFIGRVYHSENWKTKIVEKLQQCNSL